jgi:Amt family ammonium transporter
MLGTFILWFGWFGFNGGSALVLSERESYMEVALAATSTALAGGSAGITALMVNIWYLERYTGEPFFDIKFAMNGTMGGLVAITGSCGVIEPWAAVVIGFFAGIVYMVGSRFLEKVHIDDAVDAIPVHMFNGLWGLIAVGLFASPTRLELVFGHSKHPGLFYSWRDGNSDGTLLGAQLVGILFIFGWVMVNMIPFFLLLDWKGWLRSDPLEEIVGLDTSYHGGLALLAGHDGGVNIEYVSVYQKKRSAEILQRRSRALGTPATSSISDHKVQTKDIVDDNFHVVDEGSSDHAP